MSYKYKKPDKTRTVSLAVTGVILVGLLWAFFLSPALTGLSILSRATEENKPVDDYLKGLTAVKAELKEEISSCTNQATEVTNKLIECTNNLAKCGSEMFTLNSTLTTSFGNCMVQSGQLNQSLSENIQALKSQLDKKTGEFDLLVNNTAKSVCCKARIDNSNIKFYKVENSKVMCSEESGLELNCNL